MASNYVEEEIKEKLRSKLNQEKVKLWLSPYTAEDGSKGSSLDELSTRYAVECNLSVDKVCCVLDDLRLHALEKLASRNKFQQTGIASLKVKLAGNFQKEANNGTRENKYTVEIPLHERGENLKQLISKRSGINLSHVKLISSGRVIEDGSSLQEQGLKNQSLVMAICLTEAEAEARVQQEQLLKVSRTREAAEILASKDDAGDGHEPFLQIADQAGKSLQLPPEERKALTLAMTLHEKGKAAIKRKQYGEALLLLLEADKEFRKCNSDILNAVDNYAILCLDIVWCYLCLQSVNDLPDAESRLLACEDCFNRSYGQNLERLAVVKGEIGSVLALFMRLHLLQGIVAYHQHKRHEAITLLNKAEKELQRLAVDDEKIAEVVSMGFTPQEARLGLRGSNGSVSTAVAYIMKKKEEKKKMRLKEKEEREKRKKEKRLGKTASGESVSVDVYEMLCSMGFPPGAAAEALRQTNNDINMAIQTLSTQPELLQLPDPVNPDIEITDELIAQVTSMGFSADTAREALKRSSGQVERAIEELLNSGGILSASPVTQSSDQQDTSEPGPSSSKKTPEELQREKDAIDSIIPDIPENEEDYLDLSSEEELQFLEQYKALLNSL
ncbi:NEDD8 ultimate buster 1 [Lingula anatina]|uniref:NEDD8 ultimate buster 1 n=1 Tax=Lingula anatina TaxID=7574 RepID=A0A1S3HNS7_LINAN|nr:NEDD8 ultimate buster 1 [Lingula anatina]|eukprot:XP_013387690.1 NEDD8 ultimate buster 1 [Lingula anatina]